MLIRPVFFLCFSFPLLQESRNKAENQKYCQYSDKNSADSYHHIKEEPFREHPDHVIRSRIEYPQIIVKEYVMKLYEHGIEINRTRNSEYEHCQGGYSQGSLIGTRNDPFQIRLCHNQEQDTYNRRDARARRMFSRR